MRNQKFTFLFLSSLFMLGCSKNNENSSNRENYFLPKSTSIMISNNRVEIYGSKKKNRLTQPFLKNNLSNMNSDSGNTTRVPLLGQGYNSNTEEYLTQCVKDSDSNIIYNGQATTAPQQKINMSYQDLNSTIFGKANGSVSMSSFAVNGEFEYSSNAQSTENSVTFTNFVNYENIQNILNHPELTQSAYSLIDQETKSVSSIANDVCGNQFVSGISMGAKLVITVKISLNSSYDAKNIQGKLDVNIPNFGSIAGYINTLDNETAKNKSISIYITQIGGDESQLAAAIPNDALKCSLDNQESRDSCLITIQAITNYEKNIFIPSIENLKYDRENLHGLALISTVFSSYKKKPIQYIKPDNTKDNIILVSETPIKPVEYNILQSRKDLATWYSYERYIYTRTKDLLLNRMSEYQKKQIQEIQKYALENMRIYSFAGNICYNDIQNCITNKEKAIQEVKKYDVFPLDSNSITPLFNISGVWFNSVTNSVMNISQIGIDIDSIYTENSNYSQHDFGTFNKENNIQADSENILTKDHINNPSICVFNKKINLVLQQVNNSNYLIKYERVLPNKCGIEENQCSLPGEKVFSKDCNGISYQNLGQGFILNTLQLFKNKL